MRRDRTGAERFFRTSDYWRAWASVPDLTVDIDYALRAVRREDRRVLDVACGHGRLLQAIARYAPDAELHGLDINRAMVLRAQLGVPQARITLGSAHMLPYHNGSFDTVLCNESLMHFGHPHRALMELCRVSRDRVYVSVTTRRNVNALLRRLGWLASSRDVPHWTYDLEEIRALLPGSFRWSITGGILIGRKALGLSHGAHLRLHRVLGRLTPQAILRRVGQSLFVYGERGAGLA
ncbi:MAG TPA: class I SAM-dependent methyltransferase [Gemmatimonadaceae bacterium]|nr:class I SAM-dependent methyltransferase [Gemmatimonadaceae bacterium]